MACWNAAKRDFVLLRARKHADVPHLLLLLPAHASAMPRPSASSTVTPRGNRRYRKRATASMPT